MIPELANIFTVKSCDKIITGRQQLRHSSAAASTAT